MSNEIRSLAIPSSVHIERLKPEDVLSRVYVCCVVYHKLDRRHIFHIYSIVRCIRSILAKLLSVFGVCEAVCQHKRTHKRTHTYIRRICLQCAFVFVQFNYVVRLIDSAQKPKIFGRKKKRGNENRSTKYGSPK